jgi:hypothetical protein
MKTPSYASSTTLTIKGTVWGTSSSGKSHYLGIWCNCQERYNRLRLTEEEDRLVALGGIASTMKSRVGGDYFAGLWKTQDPLDFIKQLCWRAELQYHHRVNNKLSVLWYGELRLSNGEPRVSRG